MLLSIWSSIREFLNFITEKTKFDIVGKIPELYEKAGSVWAIFLWVFLPFLESWLSPIPLTLLVTSNITAAKGMFGSFVGYIVGYLCSYIGEVLGAISVFLFIRYVLKKLVMKGVMKNEKLNKKIKDYNRRVNPNSGAGSLFILVATPFVPSAIVNVVYGMSSMNPKTFIITAVIGKSIMILLLSLFTKPFELMMDNLLYMIIGLVLIGILWYVIKKIEPKLNKYLDCVGNKLDKGLDKKNEIK